MLHEPRAIDAGWSSPVARQAHNLKVVSSNLAPATKIQKLRQSPAGSPLAGFCVVSAKRVRQRLLLEDIAQTSGALFSGTIGLPLALILLPPLPFRINFRQEIWEQETGAVAADCFHDREYVDECEAAGNSACAAKGQNRH